MSLSRIVELKKETILDYPELAPQIKGFYDLAIMEIEDGESPNNEYELFAQEMENLINNYNENKIK